MPVVLAEGLLDRLDAEGGDLVLVVRPGSPDVARALPEAVRLLSSLAHPDQPDEPWAGHVRVDAVDGLPALRVDLQDRQAWPGVSTVVVGVLVATLAGVAHPVTVDLAGPAPSPERPVADETTALPAERTWREPTTPDAHRLVGHFPWPQGAVPAPAAGGPRQAAALVARAAADVVEELSAALAAAGALLARGRLRGDARVLLLAEQHGHHWLVLVGPDGVGTRVEAHVPPGGRVPDHELQAMEAHVAWDLDAE